MANSAQARKRARQAVKARALNISLRSRLRTAIKAVRKAVVAGDKQVAQQVFVASQRTIDSIADKEDHSQEQSCTPQEPLVFRHQGDGRCCCRLSTFQNVPHVKKSCAAAKSISKKTAKAVFLLMEWTFCTRMVMQMGCPPRQNSCRLDRILKNSGAMMRERRGAIRTGIQG